MITVSALARAIEGRVLTGGQVIGRGPGHGPGDTSLSVWLAEHAPDGFTVSSHAGDDFRVCRDYVRERLGLPVRSRDERSASPASRPHRAERAPVVREPSVDEQRRQATAFDVWRAALPPSDTPIAPYLARERRLPQSVADLSHVIRFHPACPFGMGTTPAMVCLVRDVITNEPRAIHRTALTLDGRKGSVDGQDRLSLGPVRGGAIKLTSDAEVTTCLGIGEGLESALSLQLLPEFGSSPVWSLLSAGGVERFPVLPGIETLWIAVDHDEAGIRASHACAERWTDAGAEAFLAQPQAERSDLNDVFKGRSNG